MEKPKVAAIQHYTGFYQKFSHSDQRHCSQHDFVGRNLVTSGLASLAGVFSMPVIQAKETESTAASDTPNTALTTIEKFERRKPKIVVTDFEVKAALAKETGSDRLKAMFSKTPRGHLHPDLLLPIQCSISCGSMVFLGMSVLGARAARLRFMEKTQAVAYETKYLAQRSYNDAIFFGGLKTGMVSALKGGLFAGIFMLMSQSIARYRNKTSVMEYVAAGFFTGAMMKMNLGLQGMAAGGVISGVLGGVAGIGIVVILKSTNYAMEDRHYWDIEHEIRTDKEMQILGALDHQPDRPDTVPS